MKDFVSLVNVLQVYARHPEIPLVEVMNLCNYKIKNQKGLTPEEKMDTCCAQQEPDTVVITNKPPLILTKDQLNGNDMEGAHTKVLNWLTEIQKTTEIK